MLRMLGLGPKLDAEAQKKQEEAKAKQLAANQEMEKVNNSFRASTAKASSGIALKLEASRLAKLEANKPVVASASSSSSSSAPAPTVKLPSDAERAEAIRAKHALESKLVKEQEARKAKFLADQQAQLLEEEKARFLKANPKGDVAVHMAKFVAKQKFTQEVAEKAAKNHTSLAQKELAANAQWRTKFNADYMAMIDKLRYNDAVSGHSVTDVTPSKNPKAAHDDKVSMKHNPAAPIIGTRYVNRDGSTNHFRLDPTLSSAALKVPKKKIETLASSSSVKAPKVLPPVKAPKVSHDDIVPFGDHKASAGKQFFFSSHLGPRRQQETASGLALEMGDNRPSKKM